ncbi:hypothetical protein QR680_008117 [Steinernema hermaphroditum]|uniref:Reverse transcriptase domain-containing protein n=1 Tax=Steinernema hermaphroditum TaxID=289476 RepID=A0AA39IHV9_9BILA|nr:hypothetical protein QR680_008117 [Steinernema hermaphroditum]
MYPANSPNDELQIVLDRLSTWSSAAGLKISVSKCFCLYIGRRNTKRAYTIYGDVIPSGSEAQLLNACGFNHPLCSPQVLPAHEDTPLHTPTRICHRHNSQLFSIPQANPESRFSRWTSLILLHLSVILNT